MLAIEFPPDGFTYGWFELPVRPDIGGLPKRIGNKLDESLDLPNNTDRSDDNIASLDKYGVKS